MRVKIGSAHGLMPVFWRDNPRGQVLLKTKRNKGNSSAGFQLLAVDDLSFPVLKWEKKSCLPDHYHSFDPSGRHFFSVIIFSYRPLLTKEQKRLNERPDNKIMTVGNFFLFLFSGTRSLLRDRSAGELKKRRKQFPMKPETRYLRDKKSSLRLPLQRLVPYDWAGFILRFYKRFLPDKSSIISLSLESYLAASCCFFFNVCGSQITNEFSSFFPLFRAPNNNSFSWARKKKEIS